MSKNIFSNRLIEIDENRLMEGIIFKKRILSINKRDSNISKNNSSFKNLKKNFPDKYLEQNIKNNETFNDSIIIPLNTLRSNNLFQKKMINSPSNSKFKYNKKINIQSPKIILNLPEKEIIKYNRHISPKIPKIIFQNGDIPSYPKKNTKKYNKIIINNIFEMNKDKENNMNCTNINNNINYNLIKNNNKKTNNIPKGKNNLKTRNRISNYSKQIIHFALKKGNNYNNCIRKNTYENNKNDNISLGFYSPRNNYNNKNLLKKYYKLSNKSKEIGSNNNITKNTNDLKSKFYNLNIKNINQCKAKRISKISLKNNINNKANIFNIENLDLMSNNSQNNMKDVGENKSNKLFTQEIKIKNSRLIDYMKKIKTKKEEENLNSSYNNTNFISINTFNKNGKRKRNLSFNFFNNNNEESNPLIYSNDDSYTNNNNITFLSNGSIFSNNNNNFNGKKVIFNRKIDYKKNRSNEDYFELAKICQNQEKIISDLVKNVQNLNNQICDKDLCINELNNQLYSIKYDLLNTLQKTNGKQ